MSGPSLRPSRGRVIIAAAVAALIVAASAGYVVIRVRQHEAAGLRPSGIPAGVSTSLANLMQLSPVPVTSAPGFTLTDQGGQTMSLASLRGRVVVLEFMDPHCTHICPIVSQEFLDAYHDLGASAPHVVFLAVNVNRYLLQVADVAAFSSEQRLTQIPASTRTLRWWEMVGWVRPSGSVRSQTHASPSSRATTMETSRSRVGSARALSSRASSTAWPAVIGSRSSGAQHAPASGRAGLVPATVEVVT